MKNFQAILIAALFCFSSNAIFGQIDLPQYEKKYADKNGVFLKKNQSVDISIGKRGVPEIEISYDEERLFLNENYKHYTEGSVGYSSFTNILSITPSVHIPDGDKYKQIKINAIADEDDYNRNIFHDDLRKKSFYYSGLVKGGKTSLQYTTKLSEPHFFGSFYFSSYLPVESSTYVVQTPADMDISFEVFGKESEKVNYSVETKGKYKTHTWKASDLNDFDYEDNSVDFSHFATHIQLYINTYNFKKEEKHVIRDVDDLYAYYSDFVKQINQEEDSELIALADSITMDLTTDAEKVKAIFYWVQDHIKYVAFEDGMGGFIPREARLVCDRKYGDCKDMSSILYSMINGVGIPAYYTWIGTRSIPYSYRKVPTPATDNHMICSYYNGKEYIFLDATGKGTPFGNPTGFIQGKEALIGISESEYKLIQVPVMTSLQGLITDTAYVRIEDNIVIGNATVTYNGYSSTYLSSFINNATEDEKEDFYSGSFKKGNNKCKSTVTDVRGSEERDESLEMDYSFEIPDYIRINGDELYFNPILKKIYSGDKINLKTNSIDKKNDYKQIFNTVLYVEIPDGYYIDYQPENISYHHDKFSCEITMHPNDIGDSIEIKTSIDINHLVLKQEDFHSWNEFIKTLNQAYSELIIFKKKN